MQTFIDLQIDIDDDKKVSEIPTLEKMTEFVNAALTVASYKEDISYLTVRITAKDEIHALNKEYRGKDAPTNILSFPFELPDEMPLECLDDEERYYLGDLIICHDVVKKEAVEQNKTLIEHYAHMLVHGTLHLLGYDHIEDADAKVMEPLEIKALLDLHFDNPYKDEI